MGASTRQTRWGKVAEIIAAWVSTVPCAALLAAIAFLVLRAFGSG
jgi:PiT family inorganic phosphate transporter